MEEINEINQSITALSLFPDGTAYESYDAYLNDVATWLAENKTLSEEIAALIPKLNTFVQQLNTYGAGVEQYGTELSNALEQIAAAVAQLKADTLAAAQQAAQSATNASQSKTLAQNYANAEEDVEVEEGEYSSKHFSIKSATSATLAAEHKAQTQTIKEETQTIKEDVELQAQNVAQSATDADASKTLAQQAAQAAQAAAAGDVINNNTVGDFTTYSSAFLESRLNTTLGSLSKSFTAGEEASITLSKPQSMPAFAVYKEVPQLEQQEGVWNIDSAEFLYNADKLEIANSTLKQKKEWQTVKEITDLTNVYTDTLAACQNPADGKIAVSTRLNTGMNLKIYTYDLVEVVDMSFGSFIDNRNRFMEDLGNGTFVVVWSNENLKSAFIIFDYDGNIVKTETVIGSYSSSSGKNIEGLVAGYGYFLVLERYSATTYYLTRYTDVGAATSIRKILSTDYAAIVLDRNSSVGYLFTKVPASSTYYLNMFDITVNATPDLQSNVVLPAANYNIAIAVDNNYLYIAARFVSTELTILQLDKSTFAEVGRTLTPLPCLNVQLSPLLGVDDGGVIVGVNTSTTYKSIYKCTDNLEVTLLETQEYSNGYFYWFPNISKLGYVYSLYAPTTVTGFTYTPLLYATTPSVAVSGAGVNIALWTDFLSIVASVQDSGCVAYSLDEKESFFIYAAATKRVIVEKVEGVYYYNTSSTATPNMVESGEILEDALSAAFGYVENKMLITDSIENFDLAAAEKMHFALGLAAANPAVPASISNIELTYNALAQFVQATYGADYTVRMDNTIDTIVKVTAQTENNLKIRVV